MPNDDLPQELAALRERVAELEAQAAARELALRECESKYRNTMDSLQVGICLIQDQTFLYVNPTFARWFGYTAEELEGKLGPADLVVAAQREQVRRNLVRRAAGEPTTPYEVECLRKDGSTFFGEAWGKAVIYADRPASVGTLIDVTARVLAQQELLRNRDRLKQQVEERTAALRRANRQLQRDMAARNQAQEQLRRSEQRFRALIDATGDDIVVMLNARYEMVIVNERCARGFGKTVSDLLDKRITDVMPPDVAAERQAKAERVLKTGRPVRFEDRRAGRWFDNNMCPVFGAQGKPQGVAIFARDITRRKAMEQALGQAKDEAEKANLAKSRFLAAANHDLRQPLQAMTLLLDALSYSSMDASARDIASDMKDTLAIMDGLLNALLDISKLEAGTVVPHIRDFHLFTFLHGMQSQFRAVAKEKGVRIRIFARQAVLRTDPALLGRILQNFVSNAIRHTRTGKILVGCRHAGDRIRIEVWDRGQGIADDQLQKIFEEFYQLGNPARNRHQGLGLGLAIAKRVADLLGLRLDARSKLGRGSVFSVEVPLGGPQLGAAEPPPSDEAQVDEPGASILVVEDDAQVLDATARLLRLWGYEPLCADSAGEALGLLEGGARQPVVALVDYRLPDGWTGIELLRTIRERLGMALPGILLTGDTAPERLREAQRSGHPLLHKPIETPELHRLIRKHRRSTG